MPFMDDANSASSSPAGQDSMKVFDLDQAVSRCFGKYRLFQKMVECYFCESAGLVDRIRTAVTNDDAAETAAAAHRLKGTVGYLAAPSATHAVARVEQIGLSGDLTDAPSAIAHLTSELERLNPALLPHRTGDGNSEPNA
jgi:HPt (histidine-containing phosphotransfer) domain-containing protein